MRTIIGISAALLALSHLACAPLRGGGSINAEKAAPGKERVFELRTYTASPGKLDALNARFRDHTNALFVKHGMTLVAYWTPADGDRSRDTLIYVLAFPDRQAREKSWKAFGDDPEWKRVKAESEVSGPLTSKIESVILKPTDYSPIH
jgi:NIPSNAP protein